MPRVHRSKIRYCYKLDANEGNLRSVVTGPSLICVLTNWGTNGFKVYLSILFDHEPVPDRRNATPLNGQLRESLGSPADARGAGAIEDNESSLESNITENVDANAGAGLQTTEASGAAISDGTVVHVGGRNSNASRANTEGEGGEGSRAGEDVATVGRAAGRSRDLGVVGSDDGGGEVEKGGAGIGDTRDAGGGEGVGADLVSGRGEHPVLGLSDSGVGDGASVLGRVNGTESVGTSCPPKD